MSPGGHGSDFLQLFDNVYPCYGTMRPTGFCIARRAASSRLSLALLFLFLLISTVVREEKKINNNAPLAFNKLILNTIELYRNIKSECRSLQQNLTHANARELIRSGSPFHLTLLLYQVLTVRRFDHTHIPGLHVKLRYIRLTLTITNYVLNTFISTKFVVAHERVRVCIRCRARVLLGNICFRPKASAQ